ncbi:MAG: hypothetical protein JWN46_3051 [Acidimicrobiales bacterium]|nr:hypothetical protein [Acidimicrobiales bacterium]
MSEQGGPPQAGWWQASDGNWYPPESHPQAAPPSPVAPPMAPPPPTFAPPAYAPPPYAPAATWQPPPGSAGMNGCLKAFLIVFAIGMVAVIGVFVVLAVAVHKVSTDVTSGINAARKTCANAPSYPGKIDLDHCADASGQVRNFGLTVTLTNPRRQVDETLKQKEICADVRYENRSGSTKTFNTFDWKLQTPAGIVQSFELTGATLRAGDLVPGGTTSGAVCFTDPGDRGRFVFIWQPEFIRIDRGIWFANL